MADLVRLAEEVEEEIRGEDRTIEKTALNIHRKVLGEFVRAGVSHYHLKGSTGYGYNDEAREKLEQLYAAIFKAPAALVRGQIVSGTHAIALVLYGVLRPGDELLSVLGPPYDTLHRVIGASPVDEGTLIDYGVTYRQVDLLPGGGPDLEAIRKAVGRRTKMAYVQKSRGYSIRPSLKSTDLADLIKHLRGIKEDLIIFVDNCYGEFVEETEPLELGADIIAGSLIKNPGGGLAPSGGYLAGNSRLVELAAGRLTAPGLGTELGPAPDYIRLLYQGLYMAPRCVAEALHGAVFAARFFQRLGFMTLPAYDEPRGDTVQAIILGSPERVRAFCRGIQGSSPVDSMAAPEPWDMPGYQDQVIMAAGTFIQGASLELTADAPMREPYAVYLQGGVSRQYTRQAVINAAYAL